MELLSKVKEKMSELTNYGVSFLVLVLTVVVILNLGFILQVAGLYLLANFAYRNLLFAKDREVFLAQFTKILGEKSID
jgi:hypothetical protein